MSGGICGAYKNTKGAKAHIKGKPSIKKYRPCVVDGKKALFHRWADKGKLLVRLNGMFTEESLQKASIHIYEDEEMIIADRTSDSMQMQYTYGIVEFEDGRIEEVVPAKIKFMDNMAEKICNYVPGNKPKECF